MYRTTAPETIAYKQQLPHDFNPNMITRLLAIKINTVGVVIKGLQVKISNENEILIKGNSLMKGYWKDKKNTDKVLVNGWLHTGDLGSIDEDGYLRITGRVKDIFKTSKGKYVAPNPIEIKLSKSNFIEQVCVVGENLTQPIALVILSEGKKIAKEVSNNFNELLDTINNTLEKHERIKKIIVLKDSWSIENNILTPTLKIKRASIEKKYKEFYDYWYKSEERILFQ